MKIFGLGIPELLIILVVILLIFGPRNLPKLGSALGRAVKGLREGMGRATNNDNEAVQEAAGNTSGTAENVVDDVVVEEAPRKTVKRVVRKKTD